MSILRAGVPKIAAVIQSKAMCTLVARTSLMGFNCFQLLEFYSLLASVTLQ
jgi:hypothetical protein